MNKLKKLARAIKLIAAKPWLLNKILDDDSEWKKYVEKKYGFSKGLPVINASDLFGDFDVKLDPYAALDGGSTPVDLALLVKLSESIKDCKYFEIGTWRGESVANVARAASKSYTLNLPEDEMEAMGLNRKYIDQVGLFSKWNPNIVHISGNSLNYDFDSLKTKFDLIFIDGDHHYEMVKNDTEKIFSHLIHENSIVVWHDYAYNPEQVRNEVFAGILDGSPEKFHEHIYHFSNSLCAVYVNKNFDRKFLDPPEIPDKFFEINLKQK